MNINTITQYVTYAPCSDRHSGFHRISCRTGDQGSSGAEEYPDQHRGAYGIPDSVPGDSADPVHIL